MTRADDTPYPYYNDPHQVAQTLPVGEYSIFVRDRDAHTIMRHEIWGLNLARFLDVRGCKVNMVRWSEADDRLMRGGQLAALEAFVRGAQALPGALDHLLADPTPLGSTEPNTDEQQPFTTAALTAAARLWTILQARKGAGGAWILPAELATFQTDAPIAHVMRQVWPHQMPELFLQAKRIGVMKHIPDNVQRRGPDLPETWPLASKLFGLAPYPDPNAPLAGYPMTGVVGVRLPTLFRQIARRWFAPPLVIYGDSRPSTVRLARLFGLPRTEVEHWERQCMQHLLHSHLDVDPTALLDEWAARQAGRRVVLASRVLHHRFVRGPVQHDWWRPTRGRARVWGAVVDLRTGSRNPTGLPTAAAQAGQ